MPPVTCPKCQKPFKSEGHLAQHMMTHKDGLPAAQQTQVPAAAPGLKAKPTWAKYDPVPAPRPPESVPQGGGVLVTSGIWEMGVALENEFLERHKAKISPEQSRAMDTNLAAYMGQAGKPISPSIGLMFGVLSIYIAPIVMEFAPAIKNWGKEAWENWDKQQKERKEQKQHGTDNRGKLPAAGQ